MQGDCSDSAERKADHVWTAQTEDVDETSERIDLIVEPVGRWYVVGSSAAGRIPGGNREVCPERIHLPIPIPAVRESSVQQDHRWTGARPLVGDR
jgi:hypothetical protein